jgi:hypothetical protein
MSRSKQLLNPRLSGSFSYCSFGIAAIENIFIPEPKSYILLRVTKEYKRLNPIFPHFLRNE